MVERQEPPPQCELRSHEGSGLFVDVENLNDDAQTLIENLVGNWPAKVPKLSTMKLYVKADRVELWCLWAFGKFSNMKIVVNGTQHFSMSSTKNSADIAMATNAIADLVFGRISHVVMFSDDSDFISLYAAIRDDPGIGFPDGRVPFLWVVTDRQRSLSNTIKQFFPESHLHVVKSAGDEPRSTTAKNSSSTWDAMARQIANDIPVGPFKSTDCQSVIKKYWPDHPMSRAAGAQFGTEFKNNLWPILEQLGFKVKLGTKPVQYEMTLEAKSSLK